jgi:hypothetical protein
LTDTAASASAILLQQQQQQQQQCTRMSHQTHDNAVNAAENQYIRLSRMPMSA